MIIALRCGGTYPMTLVLPSVVCASLKLGHVSLSGHLTRPRGDPVASRNRLAKGLFNLPFDANTGD